MAKRKLKLKPMPVSRAKTAYGLLTEIRRLILAEPKRYDQTDTVTFWTERDISSLDSHDRREFAPGACGTVGCVAGWVYAMKSPRGRKRRQGLTLRFAQRLLGLNDDQAEGLFEGTSFGARPGTARHARHGADHIANFQHDHRAQLRATKV